MRSVKESELKFWYRWVVFSVFLSDSPTYDGTHDLDSPSSLLCVKYLAVFVAQPNILY